MKTLITLFAVFLSATSLNGQQKNKTITGNGCRMQEVGKNVYAIIHENATDEWPHGNTGVIIGEDAVLVIDACYLPSMAREDVRLIKSVTKKPVKYLAYTHWHFDHNNGGIVYRDSFPGVAVVFEKEASGFLEINSTWWAKMTTAPNSAKRQALAELENKLAAGKDTSGKPFSETEIAAQKKIISQRKNELKELESLVVVKPDMTFEDSLVLDLGKRKVILKDWGNANSPHDITFYLPQDQILFTGDILVQSPLPFFFASWPVPWIDVLKQVEQMPVKAMVMGHGEIQNDHSYTRQVREFMEAVKARVEQMLFEGKTLVQVKETLRSDDLRKGVWIGKDVSDEDWKTTMDVIIERIWKSVRGQG
jgi:glyoxylase-like metal-dependent hydrolase (beta-lactamase superfamily II)